MIIRIIRRGRKSRLSPGKIRFRPSRVQVNKKRLIAKPVCRSPVKGFQKRFRGSKTSQAGEIVRKNGFTRLDKPIPIDLSAGPTYSALLKKR